VSTHKHVLPVALWLCWHIYSTVQHAVHGVLHSALDYVTWQSHHMFACKLCAGHREAQLAAP
jgi:hypothetical protein